MIDQNRINRAIEKAKIGYNKSSYKAKREFGRFVSGDIRTERKILNKFKNRK